MTWPTEGLPECWILTHMFAVGATYPTYEYLVDMHEEVGYVGSGNSGDLLQIDYFPTTVHVQLDEEKATLPVLGAVKGITVESRPRFSWALKESQRSNSAQCKCCGMAWVALRRDILDDSETLVGVSDDRLFVIDWDTGYPNPIVKSTASTLWVAHEGSGFAESMEVGTCRRTPMRRTRD